MAEDPVDLLGASLAGLGYRPVSTDPPEFGVDGRGGIRLRPVRGGWVGEVLAGGLYWVDARLAVAVIENAPVTPLVPVGLVEACASAAVAAATPPYRDIERELDWLNHVAVDWYERDADGPDALLLDVRCDADGNADGDAAWELELDVATAVALANATFLAATGGQAAPVALGPVALRPLPGDECAVTVVLGGAERTADLDLLATLHTVLRHLPALVTAYVE